MEQRKLDKTTVFRKKGTVNCRGKLLDLSSPKVMGILNVTPDSFFDGGKNVEVKNALFQTEKMLSEGADIIDVGAMSSRPGAKFISEEEELQRLLPLLQAIVKEFSDIIISVDTFRANVARAAVQEGAAMINDISAGSFDENFLVEVAKLKVPYVLMHMKGTPETMRENAVYENVMEEITDFFLQKIKMLTELKLTDIILDPGFGFAKTLEHNFTILKNLKDFQIFEHPIMTGISRKSMICKTLKVNPAEALNGSTSLHTIAILNGADILRVHDVRQAKEVIMLMQQYKSAAS